MEEDRGGERKREQEEAEYSAAVSRLADSVFMLCMYHERQAGRRCYREGAARSENKCVCEIVRCHRVFWFCICAGMHVFVHKCEEFPLEFGEKKWNAQPQRKIPSSTAPTLL